MPKFETQHNYKPSKGQSFSKEENEYSYIENKDTGLSELKVTGKTNIYEKIQAGMPGTDINDILKAQNTTLDELVKNNKVEQTKEIIDYTKTPTNFLELFNLEKKLKTDLAKATKKKEELIIQQKNAEEALKTKPKEEKEEKEEKPKGEK